MEERTFSAPFFVPFITQEVSRYIGKIENDENQFDDEEKGFDELSEKERKDWEIQYKNDLIEEKMDELKEKLEDFYFSLPREERISLLGEMDSDRFNVLDGVFTPQGYETMITEDQILKIEEAFEKANPTMYQRLTEPQYTLENVKKYYNIITGLVDEEQQAMAEESKIDTMESRDIYGNFIVNLFTDPLKNFGNVLSSWKNNEEEDQINYLLFEVIRKLLSDPLSMPYFYASTVREASAPEKATSGIIRPDLKKIGIYSPKQIEANRKKFEILLESLPTDMQLYLRRYQHPEFILKNLIFVNELFGQPNINFDKVDLAPILNSAMQEFEKNLPVGKFSANDRGTTLGLMGTIETFMKNHFRSYGEPIPQADPFPRGVLDALIKVFEKKVKIPNLSQTRILTFSRRQKNYAKIYDSVGATIPLLCNYAFDLEYWDKEKNYSDFLMVALPSYVKFDENSVDKGSLLMNIRGVLNLSIKEDTMIVLVLCTSNETFGLGVKMMNMAIKLANDLGLKKIITYSVPESINFYRNKINMKFAASDSCSESYEIERLADKVKNLKFSNYDEAITHPDFQKLLDRLISKGMSEAECSVGDYDECGGYMMTFCLKPTVSAQVTAKRQLQDSAVPSSKRQIVESPGSLTSPTLAAIPPGQKNRKIKVQTQSASPDSTIPSRQKNRRIEVQTQSASPDSTIPSRQKNRRIEVQTQSSSPDSTIPPRQKNRRIEVQTQSALTRPQRMQSSEEQNLDRLLKVHQEICKENVRFGNLSTKILLDSFLQSVPEELRREQKEIFAKSIDQLDRNSRCDLAASLLFCADLKKLDLQSMEMIYKNLVEKRGYYSPKLYSPKGKAEYCNAIRILMGPKPANIFKSLKNNSNRLSSMLGLFVPERLSKFIDSTENYAVYSLADGNIIRINLLNDENDEANFKSQIRLLETVGNLIPGQVAKYVSSKIYQSGDLRLFPKIGTITYDKWDGVLSQLTPSQISAQSQKLARFLSEKQQKSKQNRFAHNNLTARNVLFRGSPESVQEIAYFNLSDSTLIRDDEPWPKRNIQKLFDENLVPSNTRKERPIYELQQNYGESENYQFLKNLRLRGPKNIENSKRLDYFDLPYFYLMVEKSTEKPRIDINLRKKQTQDIFEMMGE